VEGESSLSDPIVSDQKISKSFVTCMEAGR
jgi:hypothetical protein